MKHQKISSVSDLEQSQWGKMASQRSMWEKIPTLAEPLLRRVGNKELVGRGTQALQLFRKETKKGELFTARNIIILGGALLYMVSPIDFIPDFLPVVGWLDDIGVLALALNFVVSGLRQNDEGDTIPAEAEKLANSYFKTERVRRDSSLQDDLDKLGEEIAALEDPELMEQYGMLQEVVLDPMRRAVVTGSFSSGKSSLINRLLGDDCLPVGTLPTTTGITTIARGEKPMIVAELKNGSIETVEDVGMFRDPANRLLAEASEVLYYHTAPILDNGFCFVDTPGIEDKEHELDFATLPRSDVFVYVKSMDNGALSEAERAFLADAAAHLSPGQLIIVLSKTDATDDPAELAEVESEIRLSLTPFGMGAVPFYRVRRDAAGGDMLAELKRELLHRASHSIQEKRDETLRNGTAALRGGIIDKLRSYRAGVESLSPEQRSRHQGKVERLHARADELVARRSHSYMAETKRDLANFISNDLYPKVCHYIDTNPVTAQTPREIASLIQIETAAFLQGVNERLADSIGKPISREELQTLAAGDFAATSDIWSTLGDYSKYILPTISVVSFVICPLFTWLTSFAIPTFFLDKFGAGKTISKLLHEMGLPNTRDRLKEQAERGLQKMQEEILRDLEPRIHRAVKMTVRSQVRAIEAGDFS